jgi:hypothetical protein
MRALEFENSPKFTALKAEVKAVLDTNTEYTQLQAKMSEIDNKIAELNKQKMALLEDKYYLNNVTHDIERRVIFDTVEDPKDAEIVAYFY